MKRDLIDSFTTATGTGTMGGVVDLAASVLLTAAFGAAAAPVIAIAAPLAGVGLGAAVGWAVTNPNF